MSSLHLILADMNDAFVFSDFEMLQNELYKQNVQVFEEIRDKIQQTICEYVFCVLCVSTRI